MLFWLIETKSQLEDFLDRGYKEAFVEVIPFNNKAHPAQSKVSLIYVRPATSKRGFIFPIEHTESLSLSMKSIDLVLDSLDKIYVRDKKEFLHYFIYQNSYDLTLEKPYEVKYTTAHDYFYSKHGRKARLNTLIPITKHYESCENIYNDLKQRIDEPINNFFNTKASVAFNAIERMGIRINKEEFGKYFYPTKNDYVYTQYNFKTLTSRPSNKFNRVNFAALSKKDDCRGSFIPANDSYVELDITAYHPTILAQLVGYTFKSPNIHQEFADMYGVSYKESKLITFRILYGGVPEKYEHLEYFSKVKKYTNKLWNEFMENGFIEDPISKKRFYRDELEDMNPPKLLNYQIQHIETRKNIELNLKMLNILNGKNTKLILSTYDSWLLDLDDSETDILEDIKQVFSDDNLSLKLVYGVDYLNMKGN